MQNITISQAQKLSAPTPFGLLSVRREDSGTNLMAVSWWTFLSNHPPMLGVCLSKKGFSHSRIEAESEFALNLVGKDLKAAALSCGTCSGRTHDKAAEFNIPLSEASVIRAGIVSDSRVVFECRLVSQTEAGDHIFYIGEILTIQANNSVPQLFAWDGYSRLDTLPLT